jgi:protein disulfide-isomerase A6
MLRRIALLAILFAASSCAMYDAKDDVIALTPETFKKSVLKSKSVWIVEFYAPWCGHCKSLAPEWKKAATALKGIAKVGAVDAEAHGALGSEHGVQGFPTIKLFVGGKSIEYNGGRTAKDIVAAVHTEIEKLTTKRL